MFLYLAFCASGKELTAENNLHVKTAFFFKLKDSKYFESFRCVPGNINNVKMERKECLNAECMTFACVQPRQGKFRKGPSLSKVLNCGGF